MSEIADRILRVQNRLRNAIDKAERNPDDVTLMAVSKKHGPDAIREACECGLTVFGENRVQEAGVKIPECPGQISWHLIGHLQRNKVRPAVELFDTIHSVDSRRLLETINRVCDETGHRMNVLLEVNVSGEAVKFGFQPEDVPAVLEEAAQFTHLDVTGLMTMPPATPDPEGARPHFRKLRELRNEWQDKTGVPLPTLSMGMSHDLEIAIEEGSNVVRIGTAIFGPRPKPVPNEDA